MTWAVTLTGELDDGVDGAALETLIKSHVRNLVEDLRSSHATSVTGSFSGAHIDGQEFSVALDATPPPPHFGGPDVERDEATGLPIDSDEYRAHVAQQEG